MTKILGFGHFKQSGKSTSCKFLVQEISKEKSYTDIAGMVDENLCVPIFEGIKYSYKVYSFADKLKEFCIDVLGLTKSQCYGSDEDKNSLTHLRWENMPGISVDEEFLYQNSEWFDNYPNALIYHDYGNMTAREVLQYFGTGICRKMYNNVWVDACLRQIKKDNETMYGIDFALIEDCRFINEADAIRAAGGKVIRFLRRPFPEDNHESEISMIDYPADAVIDNRDMTLEEKNQEVLQIIKNWGWI